MVGLYLYINRQWSCLLLLVLVQPCYLWLFILIVSLHGVCRSSYPRWLVPVTPHELEALRVYCDWLLQVGFVRVMDKLIEHPIFTGGISRIRHADFVVGEESG